MRIPTVAGMTIALALLGMLVGGCGGKSEEAHLTISYVLEPSEELPEGLTTLAVYESQVDASEAGTEDADRAKKWSRMAADCIESMIIDANKKYNTGLTVAKRRETKQIMDEADLEAAGLAQSDNPGSPQQLANVQAFVQSKLNIRNEVKTGKKRTVDAMSVAAFAGRHWGGGSGSVSTSEVETVARNLTVQCSFSMYDKAGNALFQYAPAPFRKFDKEKPSPFFGSSKTEADLDSADAIIGELVEQGTREFVSMFVPCEVRYHYDLESSHHEASAAAVRKMRGRFYKEAVDLCRQAIAEDGDDHASWFCQGIAHEFQGNYDEAINAYRQAATCKGPDEEEAAVYQSAADRLTRHKDRIRK